RNRRDAQDSRDGRVEKRALSASAPIPQRCLGPERDVQEDLRGRIWTTRRPALRLLGWRLFLQPCTDRRTVVARHQQDRGGGAYAVLCRRGFHSDGNGYLERTDESAGYQQGVRHARICGLEVAAGFG